MTTKVFIIWDRQYEKVISAHSTEGSALTRMNKENEKRARANQKEYGWSDDETYCYDFEYDEFELEE